MQKYINLWNDTTQMQDISTLPCDSFNWQFCLLEFLGIELSSQSRLVLLMQIKVRCSPKISNNKKRPNVKDFLLTLHAWMSLFCLEKLKVLKPSPYLPVVALTDFWATLKFKLMLGCDLIKYNTVSHVFMYVVSNQLYDFRTSNQRTKRDRPQPVLLVH